jgi:predicted transposase/invertase (TIGR01784 family)
MKTDTIFYTLLQNLPSVLFELLEQSPTLAFYLDEITDTSSSIGLGIIKLVISPEDEAIQQAKTLINLVEKADAAKSRNLLELVERMLVYKFSTYSRQELEAMFGLTEWQKTRFYQEIEEHTKVKVELETKLETIPRLLNEGLTVQQIARILELEIEVVKQAVKQQTSK